MKKQLLSIFAAVSVSAMFAQVPSPSWATNQNAIFPNAALLNTGVKFMDAVDANVVWVTGIDYNAVSRNYAWYSRSINGGTSFSGGNIYSDTNTYVLANMEGIDANTAWVSGYKKVGPGGTTGGGGIHRTTNGGTSWVNMTAPGMYTSTTSFANWVTFLTPMVGIANGDPVNGEYELWRTTNGGISWSLIPGTNIPNPNTGEFAIVNLYAKLGTSNLWFGTNANRIFRSTDAGLTYSVASVGPNTNTVTEIAFSSPSNGVCYMVNSGGTLELWNTSTGGATWAQVTPLPANLGQFDVVNIPGTGNLASFGAGTGNTIISYSGDNGVTWTDWGSTGIQYITGDFVDATTGWAGSIDIAPLTDVWKYSGSAVTGTAIPSAAFSIPSTLCLSGNSASVIPVNSSVGSPSNQTFSWTVLPAGATLSSATATAPTITFASANTYTVILMATNAVGSNTTSWVVTVAACTAPVASFTLPASACTGFTFSPQNTSTGTPTPGYLWSITPAANSTISSVIAENPAFQIGTAGVYSVTLLVTNASGTAQTTQTVSVAPCLPIVSFTMPSIVCWLDGPPTKTFATVNTSTNPPQATGGALTYTWSIAPSSGVSVLPNYTSINLTRVTITNTTTITQYTVTLRVRNASGIATYTQTIAAGICTGLEEQSNLANNLMVFPNPAHEQINVLLPASSASYKVRLTNILGSIVYEEKTLADSKELTVINVSNKPKGVYFLTVETNNEKVTKKIVIE